MSKILLDMPGDFMGNHERICNEQPACFFRRGRYFVRQPEKAQHFCLVIFLF